MQDALAYSSSRIQKNAHNIQYTREQGVVVWDANK